MTLRQVAAFGTSVLLVLFVYSGLIKWLPFPIDPTILFGSCLVVPLLVGVWHGFPRVCGDAGIAVLLMLAFFTWYLFSSVYTISDEFWQHKTLTVALSVLAFIVPLVCFRTPEHFRYLGIALLGLTVGIVLVVFAFYLSGNINFLLRQGFDKETTKIPDYLTLGSVLGIGVLVALARPTALNLALALSAMGALLILAARGPILFAVLMIAASYFLYRKAPRSRRVSLATYLFVLAALAVALTQWAGAEFAVERFTKTLASGRDLEQGLRVEEFTIALRVIAAQPLLGVGLGGYGKAGYGSDENIYPHNLFLEAFAESGVMGFALFTSGIIVTFALALRGRSNAAPYFVLLAFVVLNYTKSGGFVSARDLFMFLGAFLAHVNSSQLEGANPFTAHLDGGAPATPIHPRPIQCLKGNESPS